MKKIILLLMASLFLIGCTNEAPKKETTLTIYTSIYPVQYATEQITGDLATVESLYPPGVDAHTYEPTTRQLTYIARSDLFIYIGAGMESFAERTEEALQLEDTNFLEIGEDESIFREAEAAHEHEHGHEHHHDDDHHHDVDPHIWFDPLRMIDMGERIKIHLSTLYPEHEAIFEENFLQYKEKLETLDAQFTNTLKDKSEKQMIVTHAAYGYWEERYGIEQLAISGISSSEEPSQRELVALVKRANELDLRYIVFEKNSSNHVASIIQENLDAKDVYIHNLETLTEEDVNMERDYMSIMQENLQVLDEITK
ncbi:metal ABC transporter solute-binding protein, Zn/Mn family [Pseudogracilibacillus sp. ICA-222130]|uniref:metal ABC transporter solute-binding protein, Zn/Mn family n=1 Tax=Pseudogracilibacillus sp. ICA-222130 TaxID=3134655 RepID=UPI0030BA90E0